MATAKVGDRIRIKECPPNLFFANGDVAVVEEVHPNYLMALFDLPENKKVHGDGLWAVDLRWYEVIDQELTEPLRTQLAQAYWDGLDDGAAGNKPSKEYGPRP